MTKLPKGSTERDGRNIAMTDRDHLHDMQARKRLIVREQAENAAAQALAKATGRAFTFTGADGYEVTVTPAGHTFYNASDWW